MALLSDILLHQWQADINALADSTGLDVVLINETHDDCIRVVACNEGQNYFKKTQHIETADKEMPALSFCEHVIRTQEPFSYHRSVDGHSGIIENISTEFEAYIGYPLILEGKAVGTLCAMSLNDLDLEAQGVSIRDLLEGLCKRITTSLESVLSYQRLERMPTLGLEDSPILEELADAKTELEKRLQQQTADLLRQIAANRRAQESLHLTQYSIDQVSDGVIWTNSLGRIVYANYAVANSLEYTRDELLDMSVSEIDPNFPATQWPAHWAELKECKSMTFESTHQTKSGRNVAVEIATNYMEHNGKEYNCALIRDISQRKRNLLAQQTIYEETASLTGDAFFKSCASSLANLLDVPYALVMEYVDEDYTHALTNAFWKNGFFAPSVTFSVPEADCLTKEHTGICNCDTTTKNTFLHISPLEKLRIKHYVTTSLHDSSGKVLGHLVACDTQPIRDESGRDDMLRLFALRAGAELERKSSERKLREARDGADRANRAKNEFLANMSHELRTPLNGILGYAQLMQKEPIQSEMQRRSAEVVLKSGDHLLTLINEILDLAKIEAGRLDLEPTVVDLESMLQDLIDIVGMKARQKGLAFRYETQGSLPSRIWIDEKRLRQVLLNLLSNAVKFTPSGSVTLFVGTSSIQEHSIEFRISDTGIGIPASQLKDVFKPFHQISNKNSPSEGTGLGLTISRNIIQRMGGQLNAQSKEGIGSTFTFNLELSKVHTNESDSQSRKQRIHGYEGNTKRILVVDDQQDNRQMISDMLRPLGFAVIEAQNAESCMDILKEFPTDLILMDIMLPGISGIDATRRIRNEYKLTTSIVAYTANAYDSVRAECLSAGCNDFLPKPIKEQDLLRIIEEQLDIKWSYATRTELHEEDKPSESESDRPNLTIEELEELYELARTGHVLALGKALESLQRKAGYGNKWVEQLRTLMTSFKMKQIRLILAEAIKDKHAS